MKKFLLRLFTLALGTTVIVPLCPVWAQPAASGSARESKAKTEISWTRNEGRELVEARALAEDMRKRQHLDANDPAVALQWGKIEELERMEPWFISIDFPGGSLKQFLDAFPKEKEPFSFTVIGAGDASDFTVGLPAFSLHNAKLETVFGVVRRLLDSKGYELTDTDSGSRRIVNSVVGVLSRRDVPHAAQHVPPTLFDSFPLAAALADHSIDDIVGAIRAGWELDPAHDANALRLKFHPPTSILLVSGPPDALMVAAKVVAQLPHAPSKDQPSSAPPAPAPSSANPR